MKHRIAASTMTVLSLVGGAFGVAAVAAAPASAASCSTMTVTDSGLLADLVLSISPAAVTVKKGGCVSFSDQTGHHATITVDGSTVSGQWTASSAGVHVVAATVPSALGIGTKTPGAGAITVTPPPPPAPAPSPNPTNPTGGGGGGSGGGGGGGGTGGGGGGGGTGGGGGSGGHSGGGGGTGGSGGSTGGGGLLGGGSGHRGSGVGQSGTGGLLSGGSGFTLPNIPLNTLSRMGLAGVGDGASPQLAPQIGATDAAGNPLPLLGSGTQNLSLAGNSRSSDGRSPLPEVIAGLLILATGAGLARTVSGRVAGRRGAVDGRRTLRVHRA